MKYFLERDGRYFSRITVPKELRPFLAGKRELRTALGGDLRKAQKKHVSAIANLMHQIDDAQKRASRSKNNETLRETAPLTNAEMAQQIYLYRLELDDNSRNDSWEYSAVGINDKFVDELRKGMSGSLTTDGYQGLIGNWINFFRRNGHTSVALGTREWRELARALCVAEYEALERIAERDDGELNGSPRSPLLQVLQSNDRPKQKVKIGDLYQNYLTARQTLNRGKEAERRWNPVFKSLQKFLNHDDANKIEKQDIIAWRNELLKQLSPNTVSKVHLAAVRTVFNWAVQEDLLSENPAEHVRQETIKKQRSREQGFTLDEAEAILNFSNQLSTNNIQ